MSYLIAPHDHIYSLAHILRTLDFTPHRLAGSGLVESFFFFIPRSVWLTKLDSSMYGTMAVQAWAGLPTWYQMAITAVGEWIAHFGRIGVVGMSLFGVLYAVFDSLSVRGVVGRAVLYGCMLGRVLADAGMGMSAIAISVVFALVFLGEMGCVFLVVIIGRHLRAVRRPLAPRSARRLQPPPLSPDRATTK